MDSNKLRNLASQILMELYSIEGLDETPQADIYYNASDSLLALARLLEGKEQEQDEAQKVFRCNNCMMLFKSESDLKKVVLNGEIIDACPNCLTDAYLMNIEE